MPGLPLIGVEAAILGISTFAANARTFNQLLLGMSRTARQVSKVFATAGSGGGDDAAKQAARVQRAQDALARTQASVAAATQRAQNRVAQVTKSTANQAVSAAQAVTAANQRVSQAQQAYANTVANQSNRIARARQQEVNAADRLRVANDLVARAYTPARAAAAQRAQIALTAAQQRTGAVAQSVAANIQAAQNRITNAQNRATAAAQRNTATQQQGAQRVAAAQQNLQNVVATGATRISAAQTAVTAAMGASGTAVAGVGIAVAAVSAVIAGLTAALYAAQQVIRDTIQASNEYQHQLAFIDVTAGTTGAQIQALSNQILTMSRSTTTNAVQLEIMAGELLKAGVGFEQVSSGALAAANSLIVASDGEIDAARAATSLAIATEAFHVGFAEAANAIYGAAINSTLSLGNMADAIKQGGAVAARYKLDINEFAAAVALIGQVIPSGTEAGTQLRNILTELQTPTKAAREQMNKYHISINDAAGAIRPFVDIIGDLERSFGKQAVASGKVTEQQRDFALATIFGTRQLRGISTILDQGQEEYLRLANAIATSTSAADAAARLVATNIGLTQTFENNIRALGLAFGEGLDPYLNATIKALLQWAQSLDPALTGSKALGEMVGQFLVNAFFNAGEAMATIGPIMRFIGELMLALARFFVEFLNVWFEVAKAFVQAAAEMANALSPIWQAIAEVWSNLVGALGEGARIAGTIWANMVTDAQTSANNLGIIFNYIVQSWGQSANNVGTGAQTMLQNFNATVQGAVQMANGIIQAFNGLASAVSRIFNAIANQINIFLNSIAQIPEVAAVIGNVQARVQGITGAIAGGVGAAGVAIQKFTTDIGGAIGAVNASAVSSLNNMADAAGGVMSRFGSNVNRATRVAGDAFDNLGRRASEALGRLQATFRLPNFRDFSNEIANQIKAARDAIDRNRPAPSDAYAPEGTEPGSFPGGGDDGDKAAKKLKEALDKLDDLWKKFLREITQANEEAAEDVRNAYAKAAASIVENNAKALEDVEKTIEEAAQRVKEIEDERDYRKDAERRRQALDDELENEQRMREKALADAEVIHDRELEDLERIEDRKAEVRERAFDKQQEQEARVRQEGRDEEDRRFEKQQQAVEDALSKRQDAEEKALDKRQQSEEDALDRRQDAIEKALKAELDARENALEEEQKQREAALDAALEAEQKALEASQEQRKDALDAQIEAEGRARDDALAIQDIEQEATEGRTKAEQEYQEELRIGVKKSIADARLKAKLDEIAAKEAEDRAALAERQQERDAELAIDIENNKRRAALEEQFDAETAAREAAAREARAALDKQFEDEKLALRTASEQAIADMQAEFDRQRLLQQEQHEKEVDNLHETHERQRQELSDRLENERLERSKARAAEDREFAEQQEIAKQAFIDKEQKDQLERTRLAEDKARERKELLDTAAVEQRKDDEKRRAKLTEELDNEEHQRRLIQMDKERDARILSIQTALAKQNEEVEAQLAKELEQINLNLNQKIARMRQAYVDEMGEIMEDSGNVVGAKVEELTGRMESAFGAVREEVTNLIDALKEAIDKANAVAAAVRSIPSPPATQPRSGSSSSTSAPLREGGKPGETADEVRNFIINTGGTQADVDRVLGRQYGGVIPGPYGKPQLIVAHGGERFEGLGAGATAMAAVRAAESMQSRGIGGPSTVVNNTYAYNVNANYGRTQAEGSIRLDLSALVAMTSR